MSELRDIIMKQIRTITNVYTGVKYISLEDLVDALRDDVENSPPASRENEYIRGLMTRLKELR